MRSFDLARVGLAEPGYVRAPSGLDYALVFVGRSGEPFPAGVEIYALIDALEPFDEAVVDQDMWQILSWMIEGVGPPWSVAELEATGRLYRIPALTAGLIARRIGIVRRVTVASPAYLKKRKAPRAPSDLVDHDCIVYTRLATGNCWQFEGKEGPATVEVHGRYRADNSEAVREGVLAGLGIAVIPAFAFGNEIAERRVKVLLADHEPRPLPMHAVYPSRRFVPLKVRALIDFLAHEFEIDPALSGYGASQSQ